MFKDRNPSTFEEFLIVKTGKSFYIPNSFKYFPDSQVYDPATVIVTDDIIEYYKLLGTEESLITGKINQLLLIKQKKNILSELYFPMIYKKYVLGYLYIMNETEKNSQIAFNIVNNLDEFSKYLTASLIKNNYFTREEMFTENAAIVDISAGGLQFNTENKNIVSNILEKDKVKAYFRIQDTIFNMDVYVRRRWQDNGVWYYGVQFDDKDAEQIEILKNLIYKTSK